MKSKPSFWQRIGMHDWFLKKEDDNRNEVQTITPDAVYKYILQQFDDSIGQLSFAGRVVFFHEYIIAFNAEDYKQFTNEKKGIFGLIVQECLKKFYEILKLYRQDGKHVEPSSSKWVFRFVSHPDYNPGDLGFIGKLLPAGSTPEKEENLRVTYIPRQTGIAETADISDEILKDFTYHSEGYYELPFKSDLIFDGRQVENQAAKGLARFEVILPDKAYSGKKLEYIMKLADITVSGSEEEREQPDIFRIPSEWVNTPHLRIRFDKNDESFYLASFGEKTMLNEKPVSESKTDDPKWIHLPVNSKLMLNGIVGINIYKS
jgi:hypothetical protein